MLRKILAWSAHAYTALGLVAAAAIAVAIFDRQFHYAFMLMLAATVIDATDGTWARAVKVKEVLRYFDGRRLDDLIDFHTYTSLPLLLIWRANLLPPDWQAWLLAPLFGKCVWVLSNQRQDGRRVFPRLSVVLEYRRLLSLSAATGRLVQPDVARVLRRDDLRAGPLSLSHAPRPAQSAGPTCSAPPGRSCSAGFWCACGFSRRTIRRFTFSLWFRWCFRFTTWPRRGSSACGLCIGPGAKGSCTLRLALRRARPKPKRTFDIGRKVC